MTVRWTVRAANDRAPQRESRFPQGVPEKSRKTFVLQGFSALRHFVVSRKKVKNPLARIFLLMKLT